MAASEAKFEAKPVTEGAPLAELLALDDAAFRAAFAGSPVKRSGRARFIRNVLIAAGNSGDESLMPGVERLLSDESPLVRAMAVWAASELLEPSDLARLRKMHLPIERDETVRSEWLFSGGTA